MRTSKAGWSLLCALTMSACDPEVPPDGRRPDTGVAADAWSATDVGPVDAQGGSRDDAGPLPSLPCDVVETLATYCLNCHSEPRAGGATVSLRTAADMAVDLPRGMTTVGQRSVDTMRNGSMPPFGPHVPAAQIDAFEAWLAAGTPTGTCAIPANPFDVPVTCTSGMTWPYTSSGPRAERPRMYPGQACITCHTRMRQGPRGVAGTVYSTGRDPDNCNGGSATGGPIDVELTGADGAVVHLTPNAVGNFFANTAPALPYTARVTQDGRERVMLTPQMSGDCNSCHTRDGTMGAPGRILTP